MKAHSALLSLSGLLSSIAVVTAINPIVQTIYTADPAPLVWNDTLYVFTDHDNTPAAFFNLTDWHLYSTKDMVNWQHHGVPASLATFSWANLNAWAPQTIERNGKFYMYAPVRHSNGVMAIGVAVSDTIVGPYKDALGKPLVENNEFDPTVFIDDDGQAYMYWANPDLFYVKLNEDMISYSGGIQQIPLTTEGFGTRPGNNTVSPTTFQEGPWVYKRNGTYYIVYAASCCPESIGYSTSPTPIGPWTYGGVIMPAQGGSFTNHPGVVDYRGNSYFFYHTAALPGGGGFQRSVAVEQFHYNADGSIPIIPWTTAGPAQIAPLNPYVRQEAETIDFTPTFGVQTTSIGEGGVAVTNITNGAYIKVQGVDFGADAVSFSARVASVSPAGGNIEIHLGSVTGTLVGRCRVRATGGPQRWKTVHCPIRGAAGMQDVFFKFTGGSGQLFEFDYWQFTPCA